MTRHHSAAGATNDPASVEFLELRQLTLQRRVPVPRARLTSRAEVALWALRITVLALVAIVGYTFVAQLWP